MDANHSAQGSMIARFCNAIVLASVIVAMVLVARLGLTGQERVNRPSYPRLLITMERTACFGFCPIYKLTIHGDGTVIYQGIRYVKDKGIRTTLLTDEQIKYLVVAFERSGFYSLPDRYPPCAGIDLPSTILSITLNEKSPTFCYDSFNKIPSAVRELENLIDEMVNTKIWVGESK